MAAVAGRRRGKKRRAQGDGVDGSEDEKQEYEPPKRFVPELWAWVRWKGYANEPEAYVCLTDPAKCVPELQTGMYYRWVKIAKDTAGNEGHVGITQRIIDDPNQDKYRGLLRRFYKKLATFKQTKVMCRWTAPGEGPEAEEVPLWYIANVVVPSQNAARLEARARELDRPAQAAANGDETAAGAAPGDHDGGDGANGGGEAQSEYESKIQRQWEENARKMQEFGLGLAKKNLDAARANKKHHKHDKP